LLDGHEVTVAQLDARLEGADWSRDQVLYYKEDLEHKLPISFSKERDFSDYVDGFGQSYPRTGGPPPDRYAPFMPDMDLRRDARTVFAEARTAPTKAPGGRGFVLVGPDRAVLVLPVPSRSPEMDKRVPKLPDLPQDRPANIAVIAATGILSKVQGKPPTLQEASKAIPFLGLLLGLGYAGHRICIFEGHSSALAVGAGACRNSSG
jgi:hypothetical protein